MFCDTDGSDFMRTKEDRFTLIAAPLTFIFFVLPYGWIVVKWLFNLVLDCCAWNVYVEEDEEDDVKKQQ